MNLWPHQPQTVRDVLQAIDAGERRILLTSPTGGGKTKIAQLLIQRYLEEGRRVVLYTNRKLLVEQLSESMSTAGLTHGVRAAGNYPEHHHSLQVSSIQTEYARCIKTQKWELHPAELVIVDEAHLQCGNMATRIMNEHILNDSTLNSVILGLSATPIGLSNWYKTLVVAGTNSQLRACGALVPALHYGPDEPDLRHVGKINLGDDLSETQTRKAMGAVKGGVPDIKIQKLFGRVIQWWKKLNPEGRPTILFAPGVAESLWFAQEFERAGVAAAHIDGEEVWHRGTTVRTSREARAEILEESRNGGIKVLCNRFVLREGIDCPWLAHGIFATVFGSLVSYLQSGGRLLRACPGIEKVIIQDHGGNWHRHGSLNADRAWELDHTALMISGLRLDALREKKEREPVSCPQCGLILAGVRCPCGFVVNPKDKTRMVVQSDGELIAVAGDIYKARFTQIRHDTLSLWKKMYFRSRNAGRTFNQAMGLFAVENRYWPPRGLPLMPKLAQDYYRAVDQVPMDNLIHNTKKETTS